MIAKAYHFIKVMVHFPGINILFVRYTIYYYTVLGTLFVVTSKYICFIDIAFIPLWVNYFGSFFHINALISNIYTQ